MKNIFLVSFLIVSCVVKAQQTLPVKQFVVGLNSNVQPNINSMKHFIMRITAADSIRYNKPKNVYFVYTKRQLDENVVNGKLQKNATPLGKFQFVGESTTDLLLSY